ncbi:MAG: hypothetical protein EAX95_07245 [Candidatus Thorarchaeota archaeon]|nr:hypothetical protein [Candidatus Thorarchaeota archaeon]
MTGIKLGHLLLPELYTLTKSTILSDESFRMESLVILGSCPRFVYSFSSYPILRKNALIIDSLYFLEYGKLSSIGYSGSVGACLGIFIRIQFLDGFGFSMDD